MAAPSSPRPVSVRPLAVLDIVDGGFVALRQRPLAILGAVLPVVVPLRLLEAWLVHPSLLGVGLAQRWGDPTLAEVPLSGGSTVEAWLLGWLVDSAVVSVSAVAVGCILAGWSQGRDLTAGQALVGLARRWWVVLVTWLLVRVVQVVAAALFGVPALAAVVLLSVVSPVVAFEGLGPLRSIRRSVALVRTRSSKVLGVVLVTGFVSAVVDAAITAVPVAATSVVGRELAWPVWAASTIVSSLLVTPFVAAAATITYLDLRYRSEGLDLLSAAEEVLPGAG